MHTPELQILGLVILLLICLGLTRFNYGFFLLGTTAAMIFVDAWNAGIRRIKGVHRLTNMSPLGWAWATALSLIVTIPLYLVFRDKLRTREGSNAPLVLAVTAASLLFIVPPILCIAKIWESTRSLVAPRAASEISRSAQALVTGERQAAAARCDPTARRPTLKVGDRMRLGDIEYEVVQASKQACVGSDRTQYCAPHGTVLVVVSYAIVNRTNETRTSTADDFELVDGRGRTFHPSASAVAMLAMSGGGSETLKLYPNVEQDSVVAFEVPKKAWRKGLMLSIPEKGSCEVGGALVKLP